MTCLISRSGAVRVAAAALFAMFTYLSGFYFVEIGSSKPGLRSSTHRKLLLQGALEMNRVNEECSKGDIVVIQGSTAPLPNGIPTYTVQVLNTCFVGGGGGCVISSIHMRCGWFSSARLINPRVFRRLSYDDCLVNDGKPLLPGSSLSFQYANSLPYRLSVSAVSCP